MSFRVCYRDALGVDRLVTVADSREDALAWVKGLAAEVPRARGRLSATDDPLLDLSMQVVQPPYFLDNPDGLPVVYLGGAVDTTTNWQAAAITALRPAFVVIANPRRERPALTPADIDADASWRHRHLVLADVAVFWFAADDRDPIPLLELGHALGTMTEVAIGAAHQWHRRGQLYGLLRHLQLKVVVHDNLDATIAHAVERVEDPERRSSSRESSVPGAAEGELAFAIRHPRPNQTGGGQLSDVLAAAAHAARRSTEPLLVTRVYVAIDDLRLDDADPMAWTDLHDIASTLQRRY